MSEQPPYKITPDQGWIRMKNILDHEMPALRRRRRMLFFWFFLRAALVALVVGAGIYVVADRLPDDNPSRPSAHQEQSQPHLPSIEAEQQDKSKKAVSIETDRLPEEMTSLKNNHPKANSDPKNLVPDRAQKAQRPDSDKKEKTTHVLSEPMAQLHSVQKGNDPVQGISGKDKLTVTDPVSAASIQKADAAPEMATPVVVHHQQSSFVTEPLPGTLFFVSSNSDQEISVISAGVTKVQKNGFRIHPYLSLAGFAGYQGGAGGQAGAGLSMNLSRKLSFTTGASYRQFSPYTSFLSGSVSRDLASNTEANAILSNDVNYQGYETYIEGTAISSGAGYNAISPFVDQVKQWQIEGGVKYQFTRHLFAEAGLTYSFHTTVDSEYPIVEGDPFLATPFDKVSNSFNSYDLVRNTMTSWYAGVGFSVGKHWGLEVKWTHGLDRYLRTSPELGSFDVGQTQRTDVIRGLGLGLKYTM